MGCSGATGLVPSVGDSRGAPVTPGGQPTSTGHEADASAAPVDLGPTPGDEPVNFSVSLQLPGEAAMDAYLAGLTQPGSASYHQYLSPDQFGARFGLPTIPTSSGSSIGSPPPACRRRRSRSARQSARPAPPIRSIDCSGITLSDRLSSSGAATTCPSACPRSLRRWQGRSRRSSASTRSRSSIQ